MLKVYNFMTCGLAMSGLTGYAAVSSKFYQQIAGTPLIWVIMLAPLVPHRWKCLIMPDLLVCSSHRQNCFRRFVKSCSSVQLGF